MINNLIYDVGMNNGDDTAYYLYRGFKVVAVEADPTLVEGAFRRFHTEIEQEKLTILNIGIAPTEGTLDFWICEGNSAWNSFDRSVASRNDIPHHKIQVPCQKFSTVLENNGIPYYLKIDIEGNDIFCIDALKAFPTGDLPKYISIEASGVEVLETFKTLGYTDYKCISQIDFIPLQLDPIPEIAAYERWYWLLRGRSLVARGLRKTLGSQRIMKAIAPARWQEDWQFPEGSSGAFGEDTRGKWLSFTEMTQTYTHFQALFAQGRESPFWNSKDYSFWTDFHVRRNH